LSHISSSHDDIIYLAYNKTAVYETVKELTYGIFVSAMETNGKATGIVEHLPLCKCLSNDLMFLQSNWLFCLVVQSPERERERERSILRSLIKASLLLYSAL
jgi:hypothetical protein